MTVKFGAGVATDEGDGVMSGEGDCGVGDCGDELGWGVAGGAGVLTGGIGALLTLPKNPHTAL